MNTLLKNKKNILAIIAGVLFSGLILNTMSELKPSPVISVDQSTYLNTKSEEEYINVDSMEIKELILEEAISTQALDAIYTRKVENIKNYLSSRNSPLAEYAEEFVKASDKYGLDYRLVAAISIIESSGGQHTFRPYNAWGWGKNGFSNWTEGIWTVSAGMSKYYSRGLDTPAKIAPVYCPPNATNWANKVSYVMNLIEE